ncbi:metallophosphoesterase family protein [Paenibacillus chitinolyticus]|uniref:metallophosphoesterase family protein n=1 Tax=Paenibacillus chitinolyticus TaxID=79263 RepID=UPI003CFC8213
MNRRQFLRSLAGAIAAASLGAAAFYTFFTRGASKELGSGLKSASPGPSGTPAPVPAGPGKLLASFWLLSDLHVTPYDSGTSDKLKKALADLVKPEHPGDALILGGDLTEYGSDNDYKRLKDVLSGFKLPPLCANMGNHDYYDIWIDGKGSFATETKPNGKTDAQSRQRFQAFMKTERPYGKFEAGKIPVFLLSQEAYVQEKPEVGEGAWYSDTQLDWLKAELTKLEKHLPVLVMIHQPLPQEGSDGGTHRVIRANELRAILAPYPNVFVFSGHTHRDFTANHYTRHATFHWFSNSTVGRSRSKVLSQGMYIQVYEHEVRVRGREFSNASWIGAADWTVPLKKTAD